MLWLITELALWSRDVSTVDPGGSINVFEGCTMMKGIIDVEVCVTELKTSDPTITETMKHAKIRPWVRVRISVSVRDSV